MDHCLIKLLIIKVLTKEHVLINRSTNELFPQSSPFSCFLSFHYISLRLVWSYSTWLLVLRASFAIACNAISLHYLNTMWMHFVASACLILNFLFVLFYPCDLYFKHIFNVCIFFFIMKNPVAWYSDDKRQHTAPTSPALFLSLTHTHFKAFINVYVSTLVEMKRGIWGRDNNQG